MAEYLKEDFMEKQPQKEGELFPEIAEESAKDIVSRRRKAHKPTSPILDTRDLSRKIGIKISMREEEERKKRIKKALETK